MRHLNQKLILPCGLLMLSFASTGVPAAVPAAGGEVPAYHVNYADLDLGHRAGAEALFARIKSAARRVCEPAGKSEPFPFAQAREQSCRANAIANAVADVGSPMLTDVYLGETSSIKLAKN